MNIISAAININQALPDLSLSDLLLALVERDREGTLSCEDAQELLGQLDVSLGDYEMFAEEGSESYTRNRIFLGKNMELLILTWNQGQASKIHDHRGSVCCIKVLEGKAMEVRFENTRCGKLVPVSKEEFTNGSITASEDNDVHMVVNTEPERLVTLHLYSPPL